MSPRDRAFAFAAVLAVIVAVGVGLWLLGTPARQRALSLDEVRIGRLKALAEDLNGRARDTKRFTLPPGLAGAPAIPSTDDSDPVTGRPFEYRRLGAATYELCATFASPSDDSAASASRWKHPAGHHCFRRALFNPVD